MPTICTASESPNACGHYVVTVDGREHHLHEADVSDQLSEDELRLMDVLNLRYRGVPLAQMAGRVVMGDEATNVKQYTLFGPGLSITKTNIGTNWVNVLPDAFGGRSLVEFTGCTEFRLVANIFVPTSGTNGQLGMRVIRDSDDTAKLYENAAIPSSPTGERELDTDWLPLPNGVNSLELLRVQAKSTNQNDDPVFRRVVLLVR